MRNSFHSHSPWRSHVRQLTDCHPRDVLRLYWKNIKKFSFIFLLLTTYYLLLTPALAQSPASFDPVSIGKRVFKEPPKLFIVQPQPDSIIFGNQVTTQVIVDNLVLVNPEREKINQKGEGHLHIWLDKEPILKNAIEYYQVDGYLFTKVPPGKHTLVVELVNNNHSSFKPKVEEVVNFETLVSPEKEEIIPSPTPTQAKSLSQYRLYFPQALVIFLAIIFTSAGFLLWHFGKE